MKNIFIVYTLLHVFICGFGQNNEIDNISSESKILGLSKIWKEVEYNYPYLRDSELNWDSLYLEYIPIVMNSKNNYDYYNKLNEFICNLKEGHTFVISPYKNPKIGLITIALTYINIDSSFYVIGYGSEFKDKITLGSKLISINGISTRNYADSIFYKSTNFKKRIFYNYIAPKLLSGNVGDSLQLIFKKSNGKLYKISVIRNKKFGKWLTYKSLYKRKLFEYKTYNKTAYIKIGSFKSFKVIKKFYEYADSISLCKNVIIDLRGNTGGTSYGNYIANFFTNDTTLYSYRKTRNNVAYYRALGQYNDSIVKEIIGSSRNLDSYKKYQNYFHNNSFIIDTIPQKNTGNSRGIFKNKKLVVLVDRFTISAAETFIITLKNNCNVVIIGQPSYGSTGQPLIVPLPGGGHARIISSIPLFNDGSYFDFIKPDIIIEPLIKDYLEGNDRVLDKAFLFLRE